MATKTKTFLKSKSSAKKAFAAKIDSDLFSEFELLEQRVEAEAPAMTVSRTDIIEHALREAMNAIAAELDKLKSKSEPTRA